ncbi:MAG: YceI family protein [Pontiellaceae bacterium]|nr:YceI family protein [Pontiellaceae bacterium]MBN2785474.1 YceI family protein [Pontiellaceae bacterium]
MKNPFRSPFTLFATAVFILAGTARAEQFSAGADIHFKGESTLHDFEGTVSSLPFTAVMNKDAKTGQLVVKADAALNVKDMTTNNNKRDKNMFKMLDLSHFATIEGHLAETPLSEQESTTAKLHLKICSAEQDVTATISKVTRNGTEYQCTMTFPISLKAFNLKAPSVVGLIRVSDTVEIECTITGHVAETVASDE